MSLRPCSRICSPLSQPEPVVRIHLVRHGLAAAGWGTHHDPGLAPEGVQEAQAVADRLAGEIEQRRVFSSPLARARETAAPLAARWDTPVGIDPAFGEIPSPTNDLVERSAWLGSALVSHWSDLDDAVAVWHRALLAAIRAIRTDTVVFTHFVAINAVVGAAVDDPAVTIFAPATASVTVVDVSETTGALSVVERGVEASPRVG